MIARNRRIPRIEKISASLPVSGAIMPPVPKASPIIRLETIDFRTLAYIRFCLKDDPPKVHSLLLPP